MPWPNHVARSAMVDGFDAQILAPVARNVLALAALTLRYLRSGSLASISRRVPIGLGHARLGRHTWGLGQGDRGPAAHSPGARGARPSLPGTIPRLRR